MAPDDYRVPPDGVLLKATLMAVGILLSGVIAFAVALAILT